MLIVNEQQLDSFKTHYTNNFKHDAVQFLKAYTYDKNESFPDNELDDYIDTCVDFCERYEITNKSNIQRLMTLNMEVEFMQSLPYGCMRLLSEFSFSQTYRVNSLLELLMSSPKRECVLLDDLV